MKKNNVVFAHILFWMFSLFVDILPLSALNERVIVFESVVWTIVSNFLFAIGFYLFYSFFAPRILSKRHIASFAGIILAFSAIYALLLVNITPIIYKFLLDKSPMLKSEWAVRYFVDLSYSAVYCLWGTFFRFTIDWFRSSQKQKELEKQTIENELALLKSQINPHFLFNTLNNINSFAFRDQDKTSFGIIKLSEIMRYMLYEADAEKVTLDREVEYIKSYISLQEFRVKESDYVRFTTEITNNSLMVPPLLLIPFVENAFKHGSKKAESPGIIIQLKSDNDSLEFSVVNIIAQTTEINPSGGFGLSNIKRRLELLFGKNYDLRIKTEGDKFMVNLKLKLNEN